MLLNTRKGERFSLTTSFYFPKSKKYPKNLHARSSSTTNNCFYQLNNKNHKDKSGSTRLGSQEESTKLPQAKEVYSSLREKEYSDKILKADRRLDLKKEGEAYKKLVKRGYNEQFQITKMTQSVKESHVDRLSKNRKHKRKLSLILNQVQIAQKIAKVEQMWEVKGPVSKSMDFLKSKPKDFHKTRNLPKENFSFSKNRRASVAQQQIQQQIQHIQKRKRLLKLPNSAATTVKPSNNRRVTIDKKSVFGFSPGTTFLDLKQKKIDIERDNITIKPSFINKKLNAMKLNKMVRDFAFEIGEIRNHSYSREKNLKKCLSGTSFDENSQLDNKKELVQQARENGLKLSYQMFRETDLFYKVYEKDKKEEFRKLKKSDNFSLPSSIRSPIGTSIQQSQQKIDEIKQARIDHRTDHKNYARQSRKAFFKKLLDFLLFLSRHKITIGDLEKGLLSTKPHSLKGSLKLFTLVKTNQLQRVNNMVLLNRYLLFQIDNVR